MRGRRAQGEGRIGFGTLKSLHTEALRQCKNNFSSKPIFWFLLLCCFFSSRISHAATAKEILEKVDDLWRGESSFAEMTMDVVTENYERSMKLKAWSLGKEYSLFIITYPPKDRGVATLKAEQDIWNYLPRVNRVIRVPTSMMMANWMGSHFTNDDLVKESRMSEDYDSELTFEGTREGVPVYEITLHPRPEAPVVWGRIEITVVQETLIPTRSLYYDEDGTLSRVMTFDKVKMLAGRLVPTVMILVPEDKPGERTVITYESLELGLGLKPDFFSRSTLTRKDLVQ